jgi:hypothetical protein
MTRSIVRALAVCALGAATAVPALAAPDLTGKSVDTITLVPSAASEPGNLALLLAGLGALACTSLRRRG